MTPTPRGVARKEMAVTQVEERAVTSGATFERTYHGTRHVLTARVTKDGTTYTVDGKKAEYTSARAAAFAVIGPEAAESWPSLDGKQFWHIRTYTADVEAKPAKKATAPKAKAPAKAKPAPVAKKAAPAKPAPKAAPKAKAA